MPLVGSVLIGAAAPAFGADEHAADQPPRLRLAQVLESLARTTAVAAPPGATVVALSEPLPEVLAAPQLRFAPSLAPGAGAPAPSPVNTSTAPAAPLPRPAPAENRPPAALPTPRQEGAPRTAGNISQTAVGSGDKPRETAKPPGASSDASVVGGDEFLPADELDVPLPTARRPQPAEPVPTTPASSGSPQRGWGIAPIRWGGEISAGFRRRSEDDTASSTEQVYEGRLRANSYIMRPYIALISGDIGLAMVRSQDGSAAASNLTGTSVNGSGTLSVFPQSRFPFQASAALSDSRSDGSLTGSNTQRQRLSLRQDYRPAVGRWNVSGQFDRSELSGSFGDDIVNRLSGAFSSASDRHTFSTNGAFSNNQSRDQTTEDFFVLGSHGYRFSEALTLDTTATYTRQDFQLGGQSGGLDGSTQSAQIFSYASWTPEDSPWRGSANLRYFQNNSEAGGISFDSRNFGGSASMSYIASRNLNFFATVGANTDGEGQTSLNQSGGVSYSGDPITFGKNNVYNWFSSASLSNGTDSDGEAQRSGSVSLGHALNRTWQPSEDTILSGSLNQSLGSSRSVGAGSASSTTLSHGASLSLQANAGENLSGYLSTSVSDSRVSGDNPSSFQMVNVQLSGRWRINAYSEFNSNLTWQLSRQQTTTTNDVILIDEFGRPINIDDTSKSQNGSISGNLGYSNYRFFGVRGLRYTLDFRANTARDNARRRGDPDAEREPDRATLDLDQRLRYSIGRLDTELQFRVAEIEGRRTELIFFRVGRHFGAF